MDADQKTTVNDFLILLDEIFEEPEGSIAIDSERDAIIGWDSLGVLTLMAELDDRFGILLDAGAIEGFQSVNDIVAVLRENGALEE